MIQFLFKYILEDKIKKLNTRKKIEKSFLDAIRLINQSVFLKSEIDKINNNHYHQYKNSQSSNLNKKNSINFNDILLYKEIEINEDDTDCNINKLQCLQEALSEKKVFFDITTEELSSLGSYDKEILKSNLNVISIGKYHNIKEFNFTIHSNFFRKYFMSCDETLLISYKSPVIGAINLEDISQKLDDENSEQDNISEKNKGESKEKLSKSDQFHQDIEYVAYNSLYDDSDDGDEKPDSIKELNHYDYHSEHQIQDVIEIEIQETLKENDVFYNTIKDHLNEISLLSESHFHKVMLKNKLDNIKLQFHEEEYKVHYDFIKQHGQVDMNLVCGSTILVIGIFVYYWQNMIKEIIIDEIVDNKLEDQSEIIIEENNLMSSDNNLLNEDNER